MKSFDDTLLETMRKISKMLINGRIEKMTTRVLEYELDLSKTQVNELTHGKNVKFAYYQKFFSLLFRNNNIQIMAQEALRELSIAIEKGQDIIIVRLDRYTHKEVGERKYIMKNVKL